jgi:hypothetical protein
MMAYDAADGYTVLFGGYEAYIPPAHDLNDTWTYKAGVWTEIYPRQSPPALDSGSLTMDPLTGCDILFGGAITYAVNETWVYCHGEWTNESAIPSPSPRFGPATATDYQCDCVVLFSGVTATTGTNDTWMYKAGEWTKLTLPNSPEVRYYASMSWDSAMGRVILYGGAGDPALPHGQAMFWDTWELNFVNGTFQWQNITSAVSPPPRYAASLIDNPSEHSLVLIGGLLSYGPVNYSVMVTWILHDGSWSNETFQTQPTFRGASAEAFDTSDDCPLLFGGDNGVGHAYADTWGFGCQPVTFSQVGLPLNQSWLVRLNYTLYSVTAPNITFYLGDGVYPFSIGPGPILQSGEQFCAFPPSGAALVSSSPVNVNVSYQLQFMVVVGVNDVLDGWVSKLGGWINASSIYRINATPNAGFFFVRWVGYGLGNFTGTNATAVLVVDSPITEIAVFRPISRYELNFEQSGLPGATDWGVELNGTTVSSSNQSITLYLQNGTYSWRIPDVAVITGGETFAPNLTSGVTTVDGGRMTISVAFSQQSKGSGDMLSPYEMVWLILLLLLSGIGAIIIAVAYHRRRHR